MLYSKKKESNVKYTYQKSTRNPCTFLFLMILYSRKNMKGSALIL